MLGCSLGRGVLSTLSSYSSILTSKIISSLDSVLAQAAGNAHQLFSLMFILESKHRLWTQTDCLNFNHFGDFPPGTPIKLTLLVSRT